jgi:hypothetical protein
LIDPDIGISVEGLCTGLRRLGGADAVCECSGGGLKRRGARSGQLCPGREVPEPFNQWLVSRQLLVDIEPLSA